MRVSTKQYTVRVSTKQYTEFSTTVYSDADSGDQVISYDGSLPATWGPQPRAEAGGQQWRFTLAEPGHADGSTLVVVVVRDHGSPSTVARFGPIGPEYLQIKSQVG